MIFLDGDLDIILKRRNLEIGKHSSFFNYWRNLRFLKSPTNRNKNRSMSH